ncbi:MAG: PIN domain-containing protein [Austwickia sp.]|nr:PIN domain-containing protein [Actinomycetota bacterium]MCB1252804.1 PIN domain-containing protein [Austwickia sp.]MCO5309116.1 PIN domain-containing protein [Austwickia sp.]
MTVALLDVNVLLALFDPDHLDHERAHAWAQTGLADGWATCAITQNGLVRILSQPTYPNPLTVPAAMETLLAATTDPRHEYWACGLSLVGGAIETSRLLGPRQVTDTYLLALAVAQDGSFVTFDGRIDPAIVHGATPDHLVVL